jgi:predicted HicB family RNase H-like nuclease
MRNKLNYYLSLDYSFEIRKLTKEEGGGYLASIPQLGSQAFCSDGKTINEALANLEKVKKNLFKDYLKEGISIPEPEVESESVFSGKFIVRIPTELHRKLVERAYKQNISLNHYVSTLLSSNLTLEAIEQKLEVCFSKIETKLTKIHYDYVYAHGIPPISNLFRERLEKAI